MTGHSPTLAQWMTDERFIGAAADLAGRPRWRATLWYRTEQGPIDVVHEFPEISDLHDIIERGPSWFALIRAEITLIRPEGDHYTIEYSETL